MSITIKDVARKSGVCIATVSKVINGSTSISEATRQRILETIEELHYTPNYRASSLAKKSLKRVLYLFQALPNEAFQTPHTFNLLQGLLSGLSEKGYGLSVINSEDLADPASTIEQAINEKAYDGVVAHASAINKNLLAYLESCSFPILAVGQQKRINWVDTNHVLAGEKAAHFLWERGYRRFAFIGRPNDDQVSALRLQGIRNELADHGIVLDDSCVKSIDPSPLEIEEATKELWAMKDKRDVIIAEDNVIAYTVSTALNRLGALVPKQISYLTFDRYPYSDILNPKATSVDINVTQLGKEAAKLIVNIIEQPSLRIQSFVTVPAIVVGESTH